VEGITVDGGGGLRVGAGEEKVRDGVLVLRLTFVGTCSLFMDSDQTFHAIVLEYIRLADRPRILVDALVVGLKALVFSQLQAGSRGVRYNAGMHSERFQ